LGYALRRWRWAWLPTLAASLLGLILILPPTTPLAMVREAWERNAGRVRAWDWWVGYEMWQDYPLTGVGLGGYKIFFVPYKPEFLASPQGQAYAFPIARAAQAHNEYVQVAAELGLMGVVALVAGMVLLGIGVWRRLSAQGEPPRRLELLLLLAGVATTFLHAGVSFPWHLPASSLAFVVTLGCLFSSRYAPAKERVLEISGRLLPTAVGLVVGLGLVVSVIAVRDLVSNGLLLAGQNALFLGNAHLARTHLERAVQLDFCPRHSLYWLGLAQLRAGDLAGAQETLARAFTRYRAEPIYMYLASLDIELGNLSRARELLTELLASRPARDLELSARYLLAVVELREGDVPAAMARLEELLELAPDYPEALVLLGDIARGELRFEDARDYYQRALQVLEGKIRRLERKLQRPLTLKERGAVLDELERLRRTHQKVQESLDSLP
jgi:tetratricopeptide (TPR) repeat protein